MGKGISMLRLDNERGEQDMTVFTPGFTPVFTPLGSRPIPRALMRSLACWLALQTALAVPLASLASAAAASASTSGVATGVGAVPPPGAATPFNKATIEQPQLAVPVPAFAQAASGAS